ncbi:hypothetical protein TanjilG_23664 [Lupinus angustifolius]|uniref:Pollen Ole e 1 allergen and extensin family protein n=1 Tax=Lupinus angustifolius TaxID=3871 RepID=A0A4P1RA39_LUPAN|nr:PREDICTED: uncharacterized protein LOC109355257 [Lupinus angustifolius]OIW05878.1 hypothetical protein TanjilG_23664 [Lupinus angustifolius]
MAYVHYVIAALFFALALPKIVDSTCPTVKGKVLCVDCTQHYDLSDIKVLVKCEGVENLGVATTEDDGSFKVNLPSDNTKPSSLSCHAKIGAGKVQLYASRKNQVSQIVKDKEKNSYTISTPLSFLTSCTKNTKCKASNNGLGSSKTVDLPLPPEWGLAPSSFYVPVIPIIGIP